MLFFHNVIIEKIRVFPPRKKGGFFTKLRRDHRGFIGVIFALGSTFFVILAGLAIDLGYVYSVQSLMRTTADAAALAAVTSLDNETTARSRAESFAILNMPVAEHGTVLDDADIIFGNWNDTSRTFSVGVVPTNAVKVTVRKTDATGNATQLFFGKAINKDTADLIVSSTAYTTSSSSAACVLALAPTEEGALSVSGNGSATLNGCDVAVNSSDSEALKIGGNASLTANCATIVGETDAVAPDLSLTCGGATTNASAVTDPYADLPSIIPTACPPGAANFKNTSGVTVLSPGTFCGKFEITGGTVQLNSGTYILDQADLKVNGGATLEEVVGGGGVTIILMDSSGGDSPGRVTINGGAIVTLAAPTSGDYSGVVIFQDKDTLDLSGSGNKLNGGSTTNFTGALYFPNEALDFTGGNTSGGAICTQIIAGTVNFSGTSTTNSNCTNAGTTPITIKGNHRIVD